jgi:HEAT repeats
MGRKRQMLLVVLALAVAAGALAWVALREPPEPVCKGRRLSAWFQDILQSDWYAHPMFSLHYKEPVCARFEEAVNKTGTNALPCLLDMLNGKEYSPLRTKLVEWANQHNNIFHHHFWTEFDRGWFETTIVYSLTNSKTKPPISGFLEILDKPKNRWVKRDIIRNLPGLASNPETVRPVILKGLEDNEPEVREAATNALKQIDSKAAAKVGD